MASIPAPPVPLSQLGRAAHDIGLAGLLGGNLFGRLALHPSVTEISDKAERGKLVNAAWRRYGIINSLSLGAVVAGWLGARAKEAAPRQLSEAGAPTGGRQGRPRRHRRADGRGHRRLGRPLLQAGPGRSRPTRRRRPRRGRGV